MFRKWSSAWSEKLNERNTTEIKWRWNEMAAKRKTVLRKRWNIELIDWDAACFTEKLKKIKNKIK